MPESRTKKSFCAPTGAALWLAATLVPSGVSAEAKHVTTSDSEMMLWQSDVGHVPFVENPVDLEKAIVSYLQKYRLEQGSVVRSR